MTHDLPAPFSLSKFYMLAIWVVISFEGGMELLDVDHKFETHQSKPC
jgi:hypothetical protein